MLGRASAPNQRAVQDPLELLRVWNGLSIFGGMLGRVGTAAFLMWRRGWSRAKRLAFLDALAFAFPFPWIFGRLSCALAHDHPGIASSYLLVFGCGRSGSRKPTGLA